MWHWSVGRNLRVVLNGSVNIRALFRSKARSSGRHLLVQSNNRNTTKICEIFSKLLKKTPERRHWRRFRVLIVNFEQISHVVLVYFIVDFEQVSAGWEGSQYLTQRRIQNPIEYLRWSVFQRYCKICTKHFILDIWEGFIYVFVMKSKIPNI